MINSTSKLFFEKISAVLEKVQVTQADAINTASEWIAELFIRNGILHLFGTGHSHLITEDLFFRAGGFAPINAILDINLTLHGGGALTREVKLDRLEGYAQIILDNYDLRAGEIIVLISRSGINPIIIDTALIVKKMGLRVIGLTNMEQSLHSDSKHSSRKKLYELADLVIDTCTDVEDACIEIGKDLPKVSPQGTIICCTILQSIMAATAMKMMEEGTIPPIWIGMNRPGGDEKIAELRAKFGGNRLRTN
jgi:uncharacterized phosphosugar-binding protein